MALIEKSQFKVWIKALRIYYSAPLKTVFIQFRHGAIFFGLGLFIVLYANTSIQPSATQEIATLVGLAMLSYGFIVAMLAQIRLIIGRFYQFFKRK